MDAQSSHASAARSVSVSRDTHVPPASPTASSGLLIVRLPGDGASEGYAFAFILQAPVTDHSLQLAFDVLGIFYGNQQDYSVTIDYVAEPAATARSRGILDADVRIVDVSIFEDYADVITEGFELREQQRANAQKGEAVRARLLAAAAASRSGHPGARNVTARHPVSLGTAAGVTASPDRGGGGVPFRIDVVEASPGDVGPRQDDVSAVTGIQSLPVVTRDRPRVPRGRLHGGSAPLLVGRGHHAPQAAVPPAPALGGGGLGPGTSGGGSNGGGGNGGGSSGSSRGSSVVSAPDLMTVTKLVKSLLGSDLVVTDQQSFRTLCDSYLITCTQMLSAEFNIAVHTMVGGAPVFATTPENRPWSDMWLGILYPMCQSDGNPLKSRWAAMLANEESGAEAFSLLQKHYCGESSELQTFSKIQNLLDMEFGKTSDTTRSLFITTMTAMMDGIQQEVPQMDFFPLLRVFLCLRALDRSFVDKLRERLFVSGTPLATLDIPLLQSLISSQESLAVNIGDSPSSSPAPTGPPATPSANATGKVQPKADWDAGFALLAACPATETIAKLEQMVKGHAPCLLCLAPPTETNKKLVQHTTASCPRLRALKLTVVGCDERGHPKNTLQKMERIKKLENEVESLKKQLSDARANPASAESPPAEAPPEAGAFSAAAEVKEDLKWSQVAAAGAFEELDLA